MNYLSVHSVQKGSAMARVGIIGSGNAGANTAFFIAENGVSDVLLYDVKEGLSKGKALDMMEAAPIRTYRTRIEGTNSLEELIDLDAIVIAAGEVRKPEMKREDLFEDNVRLVQELARCLSGLPGQTAVIMVTEPIDLMTTIFIRNSGLRREQVMGLGGLLDSTRLRYAISRDLDVSMENVSALVIGRHNEEMIGLPNYTRISGIPVLNLMLPDQFNTIMAEIRDSGDFIVRMAKRSTAYYAPSAAIAELVDAVVRDTRRVLSVSIILRGEYGIEGVALSVPAVIGRGGVHQVLLPELQENELKQLQASAGKMNDSLGRKM
jgi:malate dehydrogenase